MRIAPRSTAPALPCAVLLLAATALAQTAHPGAPAHTAAHSAAAHAAPTSTAGGCITLPDLSPKIPAVPAGSPCPKALFTVTVPPPATVTYASPLEPDIAKTLGLEPNSFTLAYIDTKIGGGELAAPHKYYTVKYTGYLPDGTVFDASDKHPDTAAGISFPIGAHHVIPGWDNGFAGMHVGGKRRLFIPYPLAYGAQGKPPVIPAQTNLIFDMELVSQSDTDPTPAKPATPPASAVPQSATPPAAAAPAAPANTTPATPPASTQPATPPPTENK